MKFNGKEKVGEQQPYAKFDVSDKNIGLTIQNKQLAPLNLSFDWLPRS